MPIGPKILRAYLLDSTETPVAPPLVTDDLTLRNKSVPIRFSVPAGGLNALPSLTLRGQQ